MRTRMALVLVPLLLVPAVSAGYESVPPPAEANAWRGHWKTNQGTFSFNAITNCYQGADVVGGENCGATGTWDRPGSNGSVPIHGTIYLGPKYKGEVFQGCFDLPNLTAGNHCTFNDGGQISLDRSGDRMTHGYWKACGLGENCKNHHPITGSKVSGGGGGGSSCRARAAGSCSDESVRWNVTVDGFPDKPDEKDLPPDLASVEIHSKGTALEGIRGSFRATGRLEMTLTYVNPVTAPHVYDEQFTINLSGPARYIDDADRRKVIVQGEVSTNSASGDCGENARVEVRLTISRAKRVLAFDSPDDHAGECLSSKTVAWGPHRVKRAAIGAPTPA